LTLDHVEPRMRGGDTSEGNLVTCCTRCNQLKAGLPAWKYLSGNAEQRANFLAATAADGSSDAAHATAVWRRLRRAVEEAAASRRVR
jgi:5-methylcytosine-specific restriction endonuclease McrA